MSSRNQFILLLIALFVISCEPADKPLVLKRVEDRLRVAISTMQENLERASKDMSETDDEGTRREILSKLCELDDYIVDCSYIDSKGIMRVVEPEHYRLFEGSDISKQEQIKILHETHKPIISNNFLAVEGFYAVDMEYPIVKNGNFDGSVSILIRPETMLKRIIEPELEGMPVDIWVMEMTGTIIYDSDPEEIGKNILKDKLYKPFDQLVDQAKHIMKADEGEAEYEFYGKGMGERQLKRCHWTTIKIYDKAWKVVMTKAVDGSKNAKRSLSDIKLKSLSEALKDMAEDAIVLRAFAAADSIFIRDLMQEFYRDHPAIYSISWVDSSVAVRFGEPARNSLKNYQFEVKRDKEMENFIMAVENRREAIIEIEMFEGKKGIFHMYPLNYQGRYYGMLYIIRIKAE